MYYNHNIKGECTEDLCKKRTNAEKRKHNYVMLATTMPCAQVSCHHIHSLNVNFVGFREFSTGCWV